MPGLSFLSPLLLVGAAAAAIPVLLHLFHRRAEPVVQFAAMRYLRTAPVEQASRRRLKEWLLLALRAAALVLLAIAFARPYFEQPATALAVPATVVLIDTSASMTAPGQFDRAREAARSIVRGASPGEMVAIATFGGPVAIVSPLNGDRAAALEAIDGIKPGAGATRYHAALARAAEALGDRSGRIVLVSDLQETGWDAADAGGVPAGVRVEVATIPSPAGNLAITELQIEGMVARASVRNFSDAPVTRQVSFASGSRRLGIVPMTLAPGGTGEARLALASAPAGAISATVDDRAGYAADNVRYAVIGGHTSPKVLVVTTAGAADALYVERALSVAEGATAFQTQVVSGPEFSDDTASRLSDVDVLMLLGTRGIDAQGRERLATFVRNGGGLLIAASADVDAAVVREALDGLVATTWQDRPEQALRFAPEDGRHPVFRTFGGVGTLANATFDRTPVLAVPGGATVIARFSDGSPALIEERGVRGRVLVFGSDLNHRSNDLPVQPAFVPFLHETVRYLAGLGTGRDDYLVGDLAGSIGIAPGVVRSGGRAVAVNVDARESDPARMTEQALQAGISHMATRASQQARVDRRDREDGQRLWQYALVMMLVCLAAESMVGRRLG